jgi:hypothetical protein
MPGARLPMRKIRDVLRLGAGGMSKREIAASLIDNGIEGRVPGQLQGHAYRKMTSRTIALAPSDLEAVAEQAAAFARCSVGRRWRGSRACCTI